MCQRIERTFNKKAEDAVNAFWMFLGLLEGFVFAEFAAAFQGGYAFKWQVEKRQPVPAKFLTFWGHVSMHGDFWIISPVVAYVLAVHSSSWQTPSFMFIFLLFGFLGVGLLVLLLVDSKDTPSALAQNGMLPLAGAMHFFYWTFGMAVAISYYLLTPRADVNWMEVNAITLLLWIHSVVGVLQPPYKVHQEIHAAAYASAIVITIFLVGLACWLLIR